MGAQNRRQPSSSPATRKPPTHLTAPTPSPRPDRDQPRAGATLAREIGASSVAVSPTHKGAHEIRGDPRAQESTSHGTISSSTTAARKRSAHAQTAIQTREQPDHTGHGDQLILLDAVDSPVLSFTGAPSYGGVERANNVHTQPSIAEAKWHAESGGNALELIGPTRRERSTASSASRTRFASAPTGRASARTFLRSVPLAGRRGISANQSTPARRGPHCGSRGSAESIAGEALPAQ